MHKNNEEYFSHLSNNVLISNPTPIFDPIISPDETNPFLFHHRHNTMFRLQQWFSRDGHHATS